MAEEEKKLPVNETTLAYEKELQDKNDILFVASSAGGKLILEGAEKNAESAIYALISSYQTATHAELIALVAKLEANLAVVALITQAPKQAEVVKEILETLKK